MRFKRDLLLPSRRIEEVLSQSEISFGGIPRLAQVHTTIPSRRGGGHQVYGCGG